VRLSCSPLNIFGGLSVAAWIGEAPVRMGGLAIVCGHGLRATRNRRIGASRQILDTAPDRAAVRVVRIDVAATCEREVASCAVVISSHDSSVIGGDDVVVATANDRVIRSSADGIKLAPSKETEFTRDLVELPA